VRLATKSDQRAEMADASWRKSQKRFGLPQQAKLVESFYAQILGVPAPK
jgi:hypothetical protein